MSTLGDQLITIHIPEQTITIHTEFLDGDLDDTDDPKVAALTVIQEDHMHDVWDLLKITILSVTPR